MIETAGLLSFFLGSFFAADWLRLNMWQAALFMAVGKFAHYCVIALVSS
jgi:membrane protein YqaA with SNARE-associated domain